MKHSYMIFAALISFLGLNAMDSDLGMATNYITECYKDVNRSAVYTIASWTPLAFKTIRQDRKAFWLIGIFAMGQTYAHVNARRMYREAERKHRQDMLKKE